MIAASAELAARIASAVYETENPVLPVALGLTEAASKAGAGEACCAAATSVKTQRIARLVVITRRIGTPVRCACPERAEEHEQRRRLDPHSGPTPCGWRRIGVHAVTRTLSVQVIGGDVGEDRLEIGVGTSIGSRLR